MKRRMIAKTATALLLSVLLLSLSPEDCSGAYCSDYLYETLDRAADGEYVSVLVFMNEQLEIAQIRTRYKLHEFSRQTRHSLVIGELQQLATADQRDLQTVLAEGVVSGEVASFESYWIANALRIDAIKSFVYQLELRDDIEIIIENLPPQSLYYPDLRSTAADGSDAASGASVGLEVCGADSMWALGWTGQGRLIAQLDSGVDGDHPALRNSYRGNNGYSAAESWFDPVYREDYPHYEPSLGQPYPHGTNTMGVLVGKDDLTGDTTGVAWGAQWIAAMVVDVPGANYLQAFQWVADPDGDPNTIEDVPDALNNSWGFKPANLGCLDIFWTAIDNLEALGTVVLFACGNEGSAAYSLRNPANRASTIYNSFSVGAVDPWVPGYPIWDKSSRGPSDCDSISIKPEVVAPGLDIRTTQVGGSYRFATGTSFAVPHVAGAVALLREYNPNASVDTIKAALMKSADDLGVPEEDNTYGMGLIDIPAALALMPPNNQTNIYVHSVNHDSIVPGDTFEVVVALKNSGAGALDVRGRIINAHQSIMVLEDSAQYGDLGLGDVSDNAANPYKLYFDTPIPDGALLHVDLRITAASDGYEKVLKVYFRIGEALVKSTFTHQTDSCQFTVTNYGTYGLAPGSITNDGGVGFVYPAGGSNNLFQCGLLVGLDTISVSDGIVNLIGSVDDDFEVAVEGNLKDVSPGYIGDIETFSRFCDSAAVHPIGVTIEQRTASSESPDQANYVILEYVITNSNGTDIEDLYVGFYCDWDFPFGSGSEDKSGFVRSENLGYIKGTFNPECRGTAVLSTKGVSSFIAIKNQVYIYNGVTEAEKYFFLTAGFTDTASTIAFDQSYCISTGPFSLAPGESDTAAFAIMGAADPTQLAAIASLAAQSYRAATPVADDNYAVLPTGYLLEQNYPNPFNPETQIRYTIPRSGRVSIDVYNLLGQNVITLLDQLQPAGVHEVRWDGRNAAGNPVASGLYFYRLQAAEFGQVKKMLLLK